MKQTTNLFCYGSLMFAEVWQQVTGDYSESIKGWLNGYRRYALRGVDYPAAFPGAETDQIEGVLYLDLSEPVIERLDQFEGQQYQRESVLVVSASGNLMAADVYRLRDDYCNRLVDSGWSPDRFREQHLHKFLRLYPGF